MQSIQTIKGSDTWPIRQAVMWPDQPLSFVVLPRDEEDGLHFGLFNDKELISVISLFIGQDGSAQFRKFATSLDHQRKGFGSQLLNHIIKVCCHESIVRLWCNARVNKVEFYEKFGLQKTETTYRKAGHDFVVME